MYTVAPSYVDIQRIWAGTDDGLIQTTADGGQHWTDVTPPELRARPWSKISIMDAGRFDARTAYAAVNTMRLDDFRPHIYRTHDGGRTWTQITNGIADGAVINVVREDPKRKGLLFAGSEDQVWVSFDDGDHWSSLRLNMPATSIRDLIVKDDDIAVGTHGRSFYILDDIAALRQLSASTASTPATLFKPACRVSLSLEQVSRHADSAGRTVRPESARRRDHRLLPRRRTRAAMRRSRSSNRAGRVIRRYSSRDTSMAPEDIGNTPRYWIRPTQVLSAAPGFHRFVWDLHYAPPAGTSSQPGNYPISATPHDTPREPRGPWAIPGQYTVRLTVGGKSYSQTLTIRMDPRVKTPPAAIAQEHAMAVSLFDGIALDSAAVAQARGAARSTACRARTQRERSGVDCRDRRR